MVLCANFLVDSAVCTFEFTVNCNSGELGQNVYFFVWVSGGRFGMVCRECNRAHKIFNIYEMPNMLGHISPKIIQLQPQTWPQRRASHTTNNTRDDGYGFWSDFFVPTLTYGSHWEPAGSICICVSNRVVCVRSGVFNLEKIRQILSQFIEDAI